MKLLSFADDTRFVRAPEYAISASANNVTEGLNSNLSQVHNWLTG